MKKKIAISVSCLAVVLLATMTLVASRENKYAFSSDLRTVTAMNPAAQITQAPAVDPNATTIAGNFSTYQYATYFSIFGNTIDQGVNGYPFLIWQGEAFTPTANATVTQLQVAVGDLNSGSTGIELGIWTVRRKKPLPVKTCKLDG